MKKTLLVCLSLAYSIAGFAQNVEKEYLLSEYRSSDNLEYEKYTYNSNMLLKATDILLLDESVRVRDSITYDASNKVVKLDGYQLLNNTWTHVYYMDYTYDQDGKLLTRSNYNSFGGTTFSLGGIYKYFYENDQLSNWEMYMGGTDLVEIGNLTYNADGKIIEEFVQDTWTTGSMQDSWKIDYLYNNDGTLITSRPSFWNGASWDSPGAEWFYYDDNKNCIKWEHKSGDRVTNRNEYEYNTDYTVEQLVLPVSPEDKSKTRNLVEMVNMPTLQRWFTENDQGVLIYICDYIYDYEYIGTMGMANQSLNSNNMYLFPNPATETFTVSNENNIISEIDVLDSMGKVVLKESNLNSKDANLNVSNLQSGVYYVRSKTSKGINTQKLVVQ